jgi:tripartite-type tricarboxylate transporter receptor subunit TctC
MKKAIALVTAIAMSMTLMLTGCSSSESSSSTTTAAATEAAAAEETTAAEAAAEATTETDWPKETVTMVVPYSAGGDTDTYCRQMCKLLGEKLGVNFVVVNTTGGSGVVASSSVLTANNDGYTALFHHTGVMMTQEAAGSNEFSFLNDFEVVGTIARDDTYALVSKTSDTRFSNLEEMIAWAKENPGQLRFSVTYYGATHAAAVAMENTMGIEMNQIDVGSSTADRLTAFLADQCDVLLVNFMNIADYVENGDFNVLGICAEERLPGLEDFPTMKEQGYEVIQPKLYEVRMPKGTESAIVNKLSTAMAEVAEDPAFQETLTTYYAQAYYRDGATTIAEDTELVNEMKELFAEQ